MTRKAKSARWYGNLHPYRNKFKKEKFLDVETRASNHTIVFKRWEDSNNEYVILLT